MSQTLVERVQQLEDQVYALQQLLLAHVVAFDPVDRLGTDATLAIAVEQIGSMQRRGREGSANRLTGLVEDVKKCRD